MVSLKTQIIFININNFNVLQTGLTKSTLQVLHEIFSLQSKRICLRTFENGLEENNMKMIQKRV